MVLRSKKENKMADAYGNTDWQNVLSGLNYGNKNDRKAAQYILKDGMGLNPGTADGIFGKNTASAFQQAYAPSVVAQTVGAASTSPAGYGSGLVQSPNADSYYEMSGQLTKPDWASGQIAAQTPKQTSYLGDAWDGAKNLFGIGTAAPKQTFKDYQAGGGTMAEDKWNDAQFNQGRLDAQGTMNMMSGGLGAANTVLGALSYFDNKALNKKNMQLIDQQIANNQDVMKTRTERAGDIKKYFG